MRIALVSRELAPFAGWGAGTYASMMIRALLAGGHEVHVLTAPHELAPDHDAKLAPPRAHDQPHRFLERARETYPGAHFHLVQEEGEPFTYHPFAAHPQRYAYAVMLALRDVHARTPLDLVEAPDFLGEAYFVLRAQRTLGWLHRVPVVLRTHMTIRQIRRLNREDWLDHERATVEHMEEWALHHADAIAPPCWAMRDELLATYPALRDTPCAVIPLPLDVEHVRRELRHTPAAHSTTADPEILYLGRFERRKGVEPLLRACELLAARSVPFRLRLAGEDTHTAPMSASMRDWAQSWMSPALRERTTWDQRLPREKIGPAIARAACVVVPSLWENFPFAATEAMALGACVVASDAGGLREIIEDNRSGVLARTNDPASLAGALSRVLADAALRSTLGEGAHQRIRTLCDPAGSIRGLEALATSLRGRPHDGARTASPHTPAASPPPREQDPAAPVPPAPGAPAAVSPTAPRVSVIVPVYNMHEHLDETLASVRAQDIAPSAVETIVVDDGSTLPATRAAMDALEKAADGVRLRVLRVPHGGLGHARNCALDVARGEFVLPLDSDDMLLPSTIAALLSAADANPGASFVTACLRSFTQDWQRPVAGWIPLGGDAALLPVINAASSAVALMRRALVQEAGGYDTTLPAFEDWDLYQRLVARCGPGEVVPLFLVLHRLRADSMMHRLSRGARERLRARLLAKNQIVSTDPNRATRLLLADCIDLATIDRAFVPAERVEERVREVVTTNVRYRVADRVNALLKRTHAQRVIKRVMGLFS